MLVDVDPPPAERRGERVPAVTSVASSNSGEKLTPGLPYTVPPETSMSPARATRPHPRHVKVGSGAAPSAQAMTSSSASPTAVPHDRQTGPVSPANADQPP